MSEIRDEDGLRAMKVGELKKQLARTSNSVTTLLGSLDQKIAALEAYERKIAARNWWQRVYYWFKDEPSYLEIVRRSNRKKAYGNENQK